MDSECKRQAGNQSTSHYTYLRASSLPAHLQKQQPADLGRHIEAERGEALLPRCAVRLAAALAVAAARVEQRHDCRTRAASRAGEVGAVVVQGIVAALCGAATVAHNLRRATEGVRVDHTGGIGAAAREDSREEGEGILPRIGTAQVQVQRGRVGCEEGEGILPCAEGWG